MLGLGKEPEFRGDWKGMGGMWGTSWGCTGSRCGASRAAPLLQGEALIALALLLQRLLQDRLLRGKLPGRQKGARNHVSLVFFFKSLKKKFLLV